MSQLGRISGPLLKANLVRDGVDLAFETDLLYLNVTQARVGINTSAPEADLHVNGDLKASNLEVVDVLTVGNLTFNGDTISSDLETISFLPSGGEPTIYQALLQIDDFQISGNTIETVNSNANLELRPSGSGIVSLQADTEIDGNLAVTGTITADGNVVIKGNITIGDETTDRIVLNAKIDSDILPLATNTYDLGNNSYRWQHIYTYNFSSLIETQIANLTFNNSTITSGDTLSITTSAGGEIIFNNRIVIDSIEIENNTISTNISNADLEISPSGTGEINLNSTTNIDGNLNVSGNVDVTGDVIVRGNIQIGDELSDTITINASITSDLIPETDNTYDLGSSSYRWRSAYVNNFYTTTLDVPSLDIGDITFSNSTISTATGTDLYLDGGGSGGVKLANFLIVDNTITNIVSNAVTVIAQSGNGYFKIDTTNGFVPPVGGNAQRPTGYEVLGMTRYNSDNKALEVWDGAIWASPAGAGGSVTEATAIDIAVQYAITLG